jgi:hypothetical protein
LSSGIPNLKLDRLAIELNGTDFLQERESVSKRVMWKRATQQNLTVKHDLRNQHQSWRCNFQCRYRLRIEGASKTFRRQSLQSVGA